MSRYFGEIRQAGYVVHDIEAAMDHWSRVLGVGPWFYKEKVPIEDYTYRGQSYEVHNSVALANSGSLQVELIQTRNDAPSMYRDFLRAGNTGLQHNAYWTTQFDADLARLQSEGFKVAMSGNVGANGRFVYFDTENHPGTVIELSEIAGPKGTLFKLIHDASLDWDGSNPVRPFPDLSTL
ncbi:VOC family protein [Robbsia sp. KACC 23696]|uniref:VOC family protein n=1 Tax=Robbsia sp. KACC 23696 TaxID=3149231 RepID=UPI00325B11C1